MQLTLEDHVINSTWEWYWCLQDPDLAEEGERDLNEVGESMVQEK